MLSSATGALVLGLVGLAQGISLGGKGYVDLSVYGSSPAHLGSNRYRFQSTLQNYQYASARGAQFVLLPHDLLGRGRGHGLDNTQDQFLQAYAYAHNKYRAAFGTSVPLQGPTTAEPANSQSTWWQNWASYVKANNVIPDIYAYHQLSGCKSTSFAGADEQTPAYTAWFFGRFERTGITGLRANWGSKQGLHDDLARLLIVSNDYQTFNTAGDWHVNNYYTQRQKGLITLAGATGSTCYDLYVTQDRGRRPGAHFGWHSWSGRSLPDHCLEH
ncbi:hypothetical protein L1887_62304 [Cichorium endivia]|nr:hypothetical protein L1887_62304 [Cichorium endivia]